MTTQTSDYAAPASSRAKAGDPVDRNLEEIAELEKRDRIHMGAADHVANRITAFAGSMLLVGLHAVFFAVWLGLNSPMSPWRFDPFPYGLLTVVVSLEAIFLSSFVLISQNRQALQADKRAKIDLQVNMIAEQEVTKLIGLVADIHKSLGLNAEGDPELHHMQRPTDVSKVANAVDEIQGETDPKSEGPSSAADTEA